MDYSVVIPIYNESGNLKTLYERVSTVMRGLSGEYEIILVNDGSEDASQDILEDMARKDDSIVVIKFKRNFGQHPAVIAGMMEAKGDVVITLDADLQNPPEEIPNLLSELDKGYDEVSGKRARRKDSIIRKIPSFFVNLVISMITRVWLEDYGSMLRVFKKDTAKKLSKEFIKRQAYITMLIPKVTKNIKEIEVEHAERMEGESKYDLMKLIDAFIRIFFARESRMLQSSPSEVFSIEKIISNKDIVRTGE